MSIVAGELRDLLFKLAEHLELATKCHLDCCDVRVANEYIDKARKLEVKLREQEHQLDLCRIATSLERIADALETIKNLNAIVRPRDFERKQDRD